MVTLQKVTLEKNKGVDLAKRPNGFGTVSILLNWSQPKKGGFLDIFKGSKGGIDLDLAAFVETVDGNRHVIQALGNQFGSLHSAPYVRLSGDDRSGGSGEELQVNGAKWDQIKRIQVYTFIYEGVARWSEADGIATVRVQGNSDIEVRLDQPRDGLAACAIAVIENVGGALRVIKQEEYFEDQVGIDETYEWGFRWKSGRK